ncbi:MAG TPA: sensor histidine kinase, partial [Opitutaceae bacterium]|nr:sensor histidine kinase [Opitutaceae bacterium]
IIDYGWRGAALITSLLYSASVAAYWRGAPSHMLEAATGYLPAFIFTLVFTVITKETAKGKHRAEEMSAKLAEANEQLRTHASQAGELATTRERNRLAREIHDGVGHYLTVIKVQLDAADALLPADPARAAASMRTAARLAAEALDDVRRSVGTLAAESARPPLVDVLRQLANDAAPVPTFEVVGTPRPLGAAAEHALFRTAQEGLTNVRKHAAANAATLTVDFREPARVRLTLIDNGRGASTPATMPAKANGTGYGLRGLSERIALLGGTLTAGNGPERGFILSVEVPA